MKRAKLSMMKRNALICAGNLMQSQRHPALRDRIAQIAGDRSEDEVVRQAAHSVLLRVEENSSPSPSALSPRRT